MIILKGTECIFCKLYQMVSWNEIVSNGPLKWTKYLNSFLILAMNKVIKNLCFFISEFLCKIQFWFLTIKPVNDTAFHALSIKGSIKNQSNKYDPRKEKRKRKKKGREKVMEDWGINKAQKKKWHSYRTVPDSFTLDQWNYCWNNGPRF